MVLAAMVVMAGRVFHHLSRDHQWPEQVVVVVEPMLVLTEQEQLPQVEAMELLLVIHWL